MNRCAIFNSICFDTEGFIRHRGHSLARRSLVRRRESTENFCEKLEVRSKTPHPSRLTSNIFYRAPVSPKPIRRCSGRRRKRSRMGRESDGCIATVRTDSGRASSLRQAQGLVCRNDGCSGRYLVVSVPNGLNRPGNSAFDKQRPLQGHPDSGRASFAGMTGERNRRGAGEHGG